MLQFKSILAPTDFSEHSEAALRYAVAFADEFGCSVHLFHAVEHPTQYGFGGVNPDELQQSLRQEANRKMDELHDTWSAYNFPVHREIRVGNPFAEIIRYARDQSIDLIVMGTHGRTGAKHVLVGSVAERVVQKAPCPVLTVRHPEHEFVMP